MNKIARSIIVIVLTVVLVASMGINPYIFSVNAQPNPSLAPHPVYMPVITNGTAIKIGLLIPLTGPVSSFGVSVQQGVQMAMDEWNKNGGVLGKKIVLAIADGQCSGDAASAAATQLINQDKVHYIIGEVCSGASISASVIAQNNGVVMISPSSTSMNVTINDDGSVKPYVFRACFIDPYQGSMMAGFARQQEDSKAFVMYDATNDYSSSLESWFEATFPSAGSSIVGKEIYPYGSKSLSDILDEVKASNADVLYLPYFWYTVNEVAAAAKAKGITAVMMGGDGWEDSTLDLTATEGGFFLTHFSAQNPASNVQVWVAKFHAIYGHDPDSLAALGYDSAYLLFNAIAAANQDDPALVKDTLANAVYQGVTGQIKFDSHHNPQKPVVVMNIHDNKINFYATYP
jgi:branched-chain amino acid transport system substrate-binding protein